MKYAEACSILGGTPDTSLRDLRQCYRKAALRHHPDRGGDKEEFQRLHAAYQIVSEQHEQPLLPSAPVYSSILKELVESALGLSSEVATMLCRLFTPGAEPGACPTEIFFQMEPALTLRLLRSVSYTHLTLPTKA